MTSAFTQTLERLLEQSRVQAIEPNEVWINESGVPMRNGHVFAIDRETYLMWRAHAGNAKARRMWRHKDIPNRRREIDRFHHRLMTQGTNPNNRRIKGITLIESDGTEIDPNA